MGGQGTRLRPLTSTVPKPVVQLVDRPFMAYMLEWLRGHGIDDVIMSCGFLADSVRDVLGDGSALGLRLRFVEEPEPRGTAGAVKLAEPMLEDRFLMLNGDVLTDIDLERPDRPARGDRRAGHAGARQSARPERLRDGAARTTTSSVEAFVEKPSVDGGGPKPAGALISAGAYVLEREILELVAPDRNVSIEREVWPRLVGDGLYGYASDELLDGHRDARALPEGHLRHHRGQRQDGGAGAPRGRAGWRSATSAEVLGRAIPPAVLERGVKVAAGAQVGSLVVLGEDVSIGAGSTVERAVILRGTAGWRGLRAARLHRRAAAAGSVAAARSPAERCWARRSAVGADNVITRGARIFPGVQLPDGAIEF